MGAVQKWRGGAGSFCPKCLFSIRATELKIGSIGSYMSQNLVIFSHTSVLLYISVISKKRAQEKY